MLFCASFTLKAQDDVYYNSINTGNATFIVDLEGRIRTPYTQIPYGSYQTTNIPYFASYLINGTTRGVKCVYSGYEYQYTPPFTWAVFSREHTWCQSWMPIVSTGMDQYQDQHHLFPTQQNNANNLRNNHPLGMVATVTSSFYDAKLGTNTAGQTVFEPRNSHKGDAARAFLYMCVRYDGIGGYTWNFNWLNSFLPTLSEAPQDLIMLLQWSREDPPDKWEVDRNNYVQSIQQNRNPFVDHPEYANYIDFNNLTKLNPSYSVEPDNYATGFTSTVNGNSITVNWTDAVAGNQAPSGYILEAFNRNSYFIPIDGVTFANKLTLDSTAVVNINYSDSNSYTFNNLLNGTSYYFRLYSYNGNGALRNYKTTGAVPSTTAAIDPILATVPANYVTNLNTSNVTTSSITLNWTAALPGAQVPSGYLIVANNSNSFTPPANGTVYANDSLLSDGFAFMNVNYAGTNSFSFSSLNSNTPYYFKVYSYNGDGSLRHYKMDGTVPSISATTLEQIIQMGNFVLLDNFNRTDNNSLGSTPTSPTSLQWIETETVSGTGLRISANRLVSGSTTSGRDAALVNLSGMTGYPTVMSNSTVNLQWAFNFRQTRLDPSGFDGGNYGMAMILGMTTGDYLTGSGYAVVLGQTGATDAIRLVSFAGGLNLSSKLTNIISGGDYGSEYLSIRVNYIPSTNTWSLFAESDAAAFPRSNPRLAATQVGNSVVNSVYTGTALNYLGTLWNHATGAADNATYDDIYITDPGGVLMISNDGRTGVPNEFDLQQNYPNPFNPVTKINFDLPENGIVDLRIYDMLGREVATLVNEVRTAGYYTVNFDASKLSSGIYFYRMNAGKYSSIKKMAVIK